MARASVPADKTVFSTSRLTIRRATAADTDLYFKLWTDPRVMANVGFPRGLPITREKIHDRLSKTGSSEFDRLLVVELTGAHQVLGECKMSVPNNEGIATTDVKLLPEHWGNGYGTEAKQGLVDYLFSHTDCIAVEATPNVGNLASIRMQEAVGGVCVGESTYHFPESMQSYTTAVTYYIYRVSRTHWLKHRQRQ